MPCSCHLVICTTFCATVVHAQCAAGEVANLVPWSGTTGYQSTFHLDDESLTSPPIALSTPFSMPSVIGTLDQLWICANGELYLTDSAQNLAQPVSPADFGIDSLNEMRGVGAGASARIAVLGRDHQASVVAGAHWNITIDSSVAEELVVTWHDLARYANMTDRFSFRARLLLATGVVEMSYGSTVPASVRFVGISIGSGVGAGSSPSSDLSAGANSGSLGLLYQNFTTPAAWDLSGKTVTFSPNGAGGYVVSPPIPYDAPICADAFAYGGGCVGPGGQLSLVATTLPWTSTNFQLAASGFGPLSVAITMVGFAKYAPGVVPLSSLMVQGPGAGCDILHSGETLDVFVPMVPVGGQGTFSVWIPSGTTNPSLPGLRFFVQAAELDFTGSGWIGTYTTNALDCTIGVLQ